MLAVKSVVQVFAPDEQIVSMMETFRQMVNDCLRVGLANNVSAMKKLSSLCYPLLARYDMVSYYKLNAISVSQMREETPSWHSKKDAVLSEMRA